MKFYTSIRFFIIFLTFTGYVEDSRDHEDEAYETRDRRHTNTHWVEGSWARSRGIASTRSSTDIDFGQHKYKAYDDQDDRYGDDNIVLLGKSGVPRTLQTVRVFRRVGGSFLIHIFVSCC